MIARITILAAAAAAVLAAPAGAAPAGAHLAGGGTATISQVAMNVTVESSGVASGSFECLMAGRSAFVLPAFGLAHDMIVHATPTEGRVAGSTVRFSGPGRLTLDGRSKLDVHVRVTVDVATQTFQLTVVGVGAMPVERMLTGRLSLN